MSLSVRQEKEGAKEGDQDWEKFVGDLEARLISLDSAQSAQGRGGRAVCRVKKPVLTSHEMGLRRSYLKDLETSLMHARVCQHCGAVSASLRKDGYSKVPPPRHSLSTPHRV